MKCEKCGTENLVNKNVCENCGANLNIENKNEVKLKCNFFASSIFAIGTIIFLCAVVIFCLFQDIIYGHGDFETVFEQIYREVEPINYAMRIVIIPFVFSLVFLVLGFYSQNISMMKQNNKLLNQILSKLEEK